MKPMKELVKQVGDMKDKYYKDHGWDSLHKRLDSLVRFYNDLKPEQYPWKGIMLGFPPLVIRDKEELGHRIMELRDTLGISRLKLVFNERGEFDGIKS